ncbi:hypothetical protein BT96DRAFT_949413 [Gymnopus androsaceus JB14]|uniref:Uncharacterized protein n=1 Tax=Gymnopus androsaceus JB14 TaxID=1447944 RepID=A0A6A4GK10_9AGAR|nr:hypothetical protein BT96DRAFT_949413 [Gymnopus androsaceus JB14]
MSPNTLLAEHDRRLEPTEEEDDLADVDVEALNPAEREEYDKHIKEKHIQDRNYESFNLLLKHVIHLQLRLEFKDLVRGARSTHGEDLTHGAKEIAEWLNSHTPAPILHLDGKSCTGRGVLHDLTAGNASNPLKGWLQGLLLVKCVGSKKLSKELGDSDDENIDPDPSESLSSQPTYDTRLVD